MSDILPLKLREVFINLPAIAVAFSGGLDSRFLCHAAKLCGREVLAVHISGPHIPRRESEAARAWAEREKIPFISTRLNPLEVEGLADNGKERCYFCKKTVFSHVASLARKYGGPNYSLCDGGNQDDKSEYRPGLKAVKELGFISPLSLAGLGKEDIHRYARLSGLENPGQKARSCLLTRFAYGIRPDLESLTRLEKTESEIEDALAAFGEPDFRLRLNPEPVLHINHLSNKGMEIIGDILTQNGYQNCPIIFMDKISGYYDRRSE